MVLLIAGTSHTGKTALEAEYLQETQCVCLVMSRQYIEAHWEDIRGYASVVEQRGEDWNTFSLTRTIR